MTPGTGTPGEALVILFALESLRAAHGSRGDPGAEPREDTLPFRAFRERLLRASAASAVAEAELSMWWEGTFNGYALAVQAIPAGALPGLERAAASACPVEGVRLAPPRRDGYPLARVGPGSAALLRGPDGSLVEAPFGEGGGHFAAPGMRRLP
jgi:hypothetical protein